jgi:transcriptional regulator with XRE-family HTH domain
LDIVLVVATGQVGAKLRDLRRQLGLTQVELARRAGTSQAAISAYEAGAKTPSLATLERLAAAMGAEVDLVGPRPAYRGSMAQVAARLRETGGPEGDKNYAIRLCADFLTWARRAAAYEVVRSVAQPPPGTGEERFDALIAGVAEMACLSAEVASPPWVRQRSGSLRPWWFTTEKESLWPYLMVHTPAALAGRGVFIDADSLHSV